MKKKKWEKKEVIKGAITNKLNIVEEISDLIVDCGL